MIFSLLTSIAMVPETANETTNARPANNPGTWIGSSDYPHEEIWNRIEGTTSFRLAIGTDGLVQSCMVTGSSGSSLLDETTCLKVRQRARFHPALNRNGKPIAGSWSSRVRWQMPAQTSLPIRTSSTTVMTLIKEKDGSISSCKFDRLIPEDQQQAFCDRAK